MGEPASRLTEAKVEALPIDGRDTVHQDDLLRGFGVRVTPSGAKLFIARARCNGRPTRVTVGRFPSMSVAEARKEARGVLDALRAGKDPVLEKAEREAARKVGALTLREVADKWIDEHVEVKRKPKTLYEYRRLIKTRICPALGSKQIGRVTRGEVMTWHAGMSSTPRDANFALSALRAIFYFAEAHGFRTPGSNPCLRVERYPERRVQRFLTEDEVARAAEAIEWGEREEKISPFAAAGLKLAMLTGARSSEITGMRWTEVDLKARRYTRVDSKVGEITTHLPEMAVAILKALPRVGPVVIPGRSPEKGYHQLGRAWEAVRERAGLADVRCHDLRHTFASMALASGMSLPQVGELLSHREWATTKRYAHLAADMTNAASQEVGAAISGAMQNRPKTGEVVQLKGAQRKR